VWNDGRSAIASRTAIAFMLSAVMALVCRDARAAPASCAQYPIPWQPATGTQATAQATLSTMSPGATMTWNASEGTLSGVAQLNTPLTGCSDGQDVNEQVADLLAEYPALFQLDLSEWRIPEFYDCKYVDDALLAMPRERLAGQLVAQDLFAYWLRRIDGVVWLTAVNGTYLPVLDAATGQRMASCATLTRSAAVTRARSTRLTATTYSQCSRTGSVRYTPRSNDTFSFLGDPAWTWQPDSGQVLLTGQRTLRVIVNPKNYTSALLSSDARCPVADGDGSQYTVGFDLVFDVHTGAILSVKPGLDCTVC
jgi:outer membrane protein assembly factor BamB